MALWAIFAVALSFEHVSSNTINEDSELTKLKNVITKLSDQMSHFEGRIGDVSTSMQAQNADLKDSIAHLSTKIEEKIDHTLDILIACDPDRCLNNGKCLPVRNDHGKIGYECICPATFWGENCQLDRCEAAPCLNNGKCELERNDLGQVVYQCKCTVGFSGDVCQHDICEPNPCLNNGKCLPGRNNLGQDVYQCKCSAGFVGDVCYDISRSLTNDCPGQGLYVFNQENKDETKEIVISLYVVNNMTCWWYISNTLDTGNLELSFSDFESEGQSLDYLKVLKGSSTSSPQLHFLSGNLGPKKITWTDSFVSIYWHTDRTTTKFSMTGYLRYRP